jgi:hypothetical protein
MTEPKYCLNCQKELTSPSGRSFDLKRKKYCNHACFATHSNKNRVRVKKRKSVKCGSCDVVMSLQMASDKMFCSRRCAGKGFMRARPDLHVVAPKNSMVRDPTLTKGRLFDPCRTWQAARSLIQKQARRILRESGKQKSCLVCGYSKHVDACHIRDVSSFSDDSLISEINHIDNIVPLCKNHHWEYDHDLMETEDRIKIAA